MSFLSHHSSGLASVGSCSFRGHVLDRKYFFEYDVGLWPFGQVQVVKDRRTGDFKICKLVQKALVRNPQETVLRLKRLRELQQEHISGVTDVLEDQELIYVVSDKPAGGDVGEWLTRMQDEGNWLQEHIVAEYIRQALIALHHGHSSRTLHRDLRPSSLLLTSKLPDAKVKVADFGLTELFDPGNEIMTRNPSPYAAPEAQQPCCGPFPPLRTATDIWSIGAIAHHLLCGVPPQNLEASSGAWAAIARVGNRGGHEGTAESDAFMLERTPLARDFVSKMLKHDAASRPTAAQALQHPWMEACLTLDSGCWLANEVTAELKSRLQCYMLAILILPAAVQYRDLFQLRSSFGNVDADHDGFVSRAVAHRVLKERGSQPQDAAAALDAVDVKATGVVDFAAMCAALVIATSFCNVEGKERPRRPADVVPRLVEGFFRFFGDAQRMVSSTATVTEKHVRVVVRDVEGHAGIDYQEVLNAICENEHFDDKALLEGITHCQGRGTPLTPGDCSDDEESDINWGDSIGLNRVQDIFKGVFQTCGLSNASSSGPCELPHCEVGIKYSCAVPMDWPNASSSSGSSAGKSRDESYKRIPEPRWSANDGHRT